MTRKRVYEEMELADSENGPSLLTKLRNTWEFANLMQYIYIFGKAVKIDEDLDIEVHTVDLDLAGLRHSMKESYWFTMYAEFVSV